MKETGFHEATSKIFQEFGLSEINSGVFGGRPPAMADREVIDVHSPINGELLAKVSLAHEEDCERVIKAAEESYYEWSALPPPQRGDVIRQIGLELMRHKEALGLLVTLEAGKTIIEGQGEVQEMIDIANFASGLSRQIYGLTIASERKQHRLYEQWQPLGPISVITTFNFPVAVWSWNTLISAVVGDVTIWKPSSRTPLTAISVTHLVNQVLKRNSLKPISFLAVGRGRGVGRYLVNDPRLPLVSFTGSVKTGRDVAENVARRLGRSLLELGGNNAAIVSDRCDQNMALKGVAFGALATAGQRCTSTRRLILQEETYGAFLDRLVKAYSRVNVGSPMDQGTLMGPLIDEGAVQDYLAAVEEARRQGGKVLHGGNAISLKGMENGFYVAPTLIEIAADAPIVQQETFAPILYVMKYRTIEEALEIHNNVPQGLSSGIFTNDLREEEYFLSHQGSDCGLANVNTSTAGAEIGGAFGGEKQTGGGRESGSDAWKIYARRQTVTINYGPDLPLAQGVKFEI
jgi:aldehyde dehydrogenase (NAD+)